MLYGKQTAAEVLSEQLTASEGVVKFFTGRIKTSTTQATSCLENAVAITLTGSLLMMQ
uniref:Uncharacterized protein n=1 Tax=Salmonella sp. TaxID=599 RepID=A0A482EVU8_SALSP|nr:hypothetical protein NNIBIDOC_00236 [Salmonella sp.]